jgi:hypothetical protein
MSAGVRTQGAFAVEFRILGLEHAWLHRGSEAV